MVAASDGGRRSREEWEGVTGSDGWCWRMLASLRITCALFGEDRRCLEGGRGGRKLEWKKGKRTWKESGREWGKEGKKWDNSALVDETDVHWLVPSTPTPTHPHNSHLPVNILHMNSAMINGCMLFQALRPRVAVIMGNPLVCSPREDIWASRKHKPTLFVLHTAVVHSEHRRGTGVLRERTSLLRNHWGLRTGIGSKFNVDSLLPRLHWTWG